MIKRRTKKQKQNTKHPFLISWDPKPEKPTPEANVKRQSASTDKQISADIGNGEVADFSDSSQDLKRIRRNIYKSLILAGLILASEAVLYFVWNVK